MRAADLRRCGVEILRAHANGAFPTENVQKLLALPTATRSPKGGGVRNLQRRLSENEVREAAELYRAGASLVDLGKRYSVGRQTISKVLERQGVDRRYNLIGDEQAESLRVRYEAGASLRQLGDEIGVDAETVRRALLRIGAKTRPRKGARSSQ